MKTDNEVKDKIVTAQEMMVCGWKWYVEMTW